MNYREEIAAYRPRGEEEAADQALILSMIEHFPDTVLTRECLAGHITSSGFIVNETRDKTLMAWHNIYRSWAWTGGHADGAPDLLAVALREAREETGILRVSPLSREIAGLDVLTVPGHVKRGKYVSTHLHLSVAYLLTAPEDQPLAVKSDENSGVQWIPISEIESYSSEPEMYPVYRKLVERMRKLP